jgi:hypothetical protein
MRRIPVRVFLFERAIRRESGHLSIVTVRCNFMLDRWCHHRGSGDGHASDGGGGGRWLRRPSRSSWRCCWPAWCGRSRSRASGSLIVHGADARRVRPDPAPAADAGRQDAPGDQESLGKPSACGQASPVLTAGSTTPGPLGLGYACRDWSYPRSPALAAGAMPALTASALGRSRLGRIASAGH